MNYMEEEMRSVELSYNDNVSPLSGQDNGKGRYPIKRTIIVFFSLVLFGESAFSAARRWHEPSRRYLAIEDVNIWIVMLAGMYHLYFLTRESRTILHIITDSSERQFHWLAANPQMHLLLKQFKKKVRMDIKFIKFVLVSILLNYICPPLFLTSYKLAAFDERDVMQLNLPFEFYHLNVPRQYRFTAFVIINLLQIVFVKIIVDVSKFMFISFAGPVSKIVLDIKLLCVAISSLDTHVQFQGSMNRFSGHQSATDKFQNNAHCQEIMLRNYVRNIVQQHINICRNVAGLNRSIRVLAFYTIPSICVQLCLLFYWILEVDSSWLHQMVDASQMLGVCGYGYLYSSVGQNVINQDEVLRRTLLECSWVKKPLWFRRTLLLMLTRTTRHLSITPYRLFVIDFVHFTSMMNAAYSYYNFLRTTKKVYQ